MPTYPCAHCESRYRSVKTLEYHLWNVGKNLDWYCRANPWAIEDVQRYQAAKSSPPAPAIALSADAAAPDEGPVTGPSGPAPALIPFETDPPRIIAPKLRDLEAEAITNWSSDVLAEWRSRHATSRDRHAGLYRFVWHALFTDSEGFKQICRAQVKAPKHPYQLPVRHFFTILARAIKPDIIGELSSAAGTSQEIGTKMARTSLRREVNIKRLTDYAVRIIRWAGEHNVHPDDFSAWFDAQGGATAIISAYDEQFASRRDGPTAEDNAKLAAEKAAHGILGGISDTSATNADGKSLALSRHLLLRLDRALANEPDEDAAQIRKVIAAILASE